MYMDYKFPCYTSVSYLFKDHVSCIFTVLYQLIINHLLLLFYKLFCFLFNKQLHSGVGVQIRLSCFSIVWHASTQLRKPANFCMASQHPRTFERGLSQCSQPGRSECSDLPRLENYTLYNPASWGSKYFVQSLNALVFGKSG